MSANCGRPMTMTRHTADRLLVSPAASPPTSPRFFRALKWPLAPQCLRPNPRAAADRPIARRRAPLVVETERFRRPGLARHGATESAALACGTATVQHANPVLPEG